MITFPNAKINLGLQVLRKRPDGYHEVRSVMVPVAISDVLEIILRPVSWKPLEDAGLVPAFADEKIVFYSTGIPINGLPETNLCIKAARLFISEMPFPEKIEMHLHKIIPHGAGLGGGSSDAANVLLLLNKLTGNRAGDSHLEEMASALGSDCPFFIRNRPAIASGRGEILVPFKLDLASYTICIAKPLVAVSTAEAYTSVTPVMHELSPEKMLGEEIALWQDTVINDFEKWARKRYPEIDTLIETIKEAGAVYVAMSGSGSAVFGIFKGAVPNINASEGTFIWTGSALPAKG
ncbi:MAG TPA: 4-(cytidine 5'-diphospho)-2-C-methyl-D-erythritol kinase [Bacteroidia bacterium]|nr:4-(cytidine 5'-diphospho)-2-C-methyl-D-erythritol kinase [Bacteroidia bacterium]